MASWQYDLIFIGKLNSLAILEKGLLIEDIDLRKENVFADTESFFCKLDSITTRWIDSDDFKSWGSDAGDRIDVSIEEGGIEYLKARVDVRRINESFLKFIIQLATELNFTLIDSKLRAIPVDFEGVLHAVQNSDAARFVADPAKFLDQAKKEYFGTEE